MRKKLLKKLKNKLKKNLGLPRIYLLVSKTRHTVKYVRQGG